MDMGNKPVARHFQAHAVVAELIAVVGADDAGCALVVPAVKMEVEVDDVPVGLSKYARPSGAEDIGTHSAVADQAKDQGRWVDGHTQNMADKTTVVLGSMAQGLVGAKPSVETFVYVAGQTGLNFSPGLRHETQTCW